MLTSRKVAVLLAGLALFGLAPLAFATTFYVDGATGSHANNGRSWDTAFRYMSDATAQADTAGDVVYARNLNVGTASDSASLNAITVKYNGKAGARITFIGKLNGQNYCDSLTYRVPSIDFQGRSYITVKGFSVRGGMSMSALHPESSRDSLCMYDSLAYCRIDSMATMHGAVGCVFAHNWLRNKFELMGAYANNGYFVCDQWIDNDYCATSGSPILRTFQASFSDTIRGNIIDSYCTQDSYANNGLKFGGLSQACLVDSNKITNTHYGVVGSGTYDESHAAIFYEYGRSEGLPNYFKYNHWSNVATQSAQNNHSWELWRIRSASQNNYWYGDTLDAGTDATSKASGAGFTVFFSASAGDSFTHCICKYQWPAGGGEYNYMPRDNHWDHCVVNIQGPAQFQGGMMGGWMRDCALTMNSSNALQIAASSVYGFEFTRCTFAAPNRVVWFTWDSYGLVMQVTFQQCLFYSDSLVTTQIGFDHVNNFPSDFISFNNLHYSQKTAGTATRCYGGQFTGKTLSQACNTAGYYVGCASVWGDPYFTNRTFSTLDEHFKLQSPTKAIGSSWLSGTCGVVGRRPVCYTGGYPPVDSIRPAGCVIDSIYAIGGNLLKTVVFHGSGDDSLTYEADSLFIVELPTAVPPGDSKISADPTSALYWRNYIIAAVKAPATYSSSQTWTWQVVMSGTRPDGSLGTALLNGLATGNGWTDYANSTDGTFGPTLGVYGIGNYAIICRDWYGNISDPSSTYMYYTP